jgi:uncharacterized protein (DUF58 family)
MTAERGLSPSSVAARPVSGKRLPFAFGSRFFIALLLGTVWTMPAWFGSSSSQLRFIGAMFLWDLAVLGAWFVDLLRLPAQSQLEVRRIWSGPLTLAHASEVTIEVHNSGGIDIGVSVVDELHSDLRHEPPSLTIEVPRGASASRQYDVMPRRRGDIAAGRAFLRYRSALGLAERWARADLSQTVRVLPDLAQAQTYALYLIRSRQVEMEKRRRRQRGQGRDFESLREYRRGDEMRDICWTATARRNNLTTRVYQVERSQAVWIVMDAGRLLRTEVREPGCAIAREKLDFSVDAALSLAQVASQSGDRVGLLAYGRKIQQSVAGGRGALHLRAMLDALAQVRSEAAEGNHSLAVRTLLRHQSRRSLIVWLTDFAETAITPEVIDYAVHLTSRHVVVFAAIGQPDLAELAGTIPRNAEEMFRHAAALEVVQRRQRLFRQLRERGVLVIDIAAAGLAAALVNQYLEVKDRNLI